MLDKASFIKISDSRDGDPTAALTLSSAINNDNNAEHHNKLKRFALERSRDQTFIASMQQELQVIPHQVLKFPSSLADCK